MSLPQHIGDLILPCPSGHSETFTVEPSSRTMVRSSSGASQAPQVVLTDMLHWGHE